MSYTVIRSHEICAGHRVVGHESKCRHLHGHNYKFHFHVAPKVCTHSLAMGLRADEPVHCQKCGKVASDLDNVGRVIDFSVVKSTLCEWLEQSWDHKFLHWEEDKVINGLKQLIAEDEFIPNGPFVPDSEVPHFMDSLVSLPFNPTAENLAAYMVQVIGPQLLDEHGVELVSCVIEETSKCHVEYTK